MSVWSCEIMCSNCGKTESVHNSLGEISQVAERWGSFGGALYCPNCVKTWHERNKKPMSDFKNTFNVIFMKFFDRYAEQQEVSDNGWALTVMDHAPAIVPAEGGTDDVRCL